MPGKLHQQSVAINWNQHLSFAVIHVWDDLAHIDCDRLWAAVFMFFQLNDDVILHRLDAVDDAAFIEVTDPLPNNVCPRCMPVLDSLAL